MKTDWQIAKNNLAGHTLCLCKDGECLFSDRRGIAPMMGWIGEGKNLVGYSAADLVVGKAAAMLFAKSGIVTVYADTLSESGKAFLEAQGIPCFYRTLTKRILNRAGTDVCPMEKAVLNAETAEEGYEILKRQWQKMNVQP